MKLSPEEAERFYSKIAKTDNPDECWEWTGGKNRSGYGNFSCSGKTYRANRLAYELATNTDPGELFVLHSCDNRACCNPNHLWLGTNSDNMLDMYRKGRANFSRRTGDGHPESKLTAAQVQEIRQKYVPYKVTLQQLAKEYGVGHATIHKIVHRVRWKNV